MASSCPPPPKFQRGKSRRRWQVLKSPIQPEPTEPTDNGGSVAPSVPPPPRFRHWMSRSQRRRRRPLKLSQQSEPPLATEPTDNGGSVAPSVPPPPRVWVWLTKRQRRRRRAHIKLSRKSEPPLATEPTENGGSVAPSVPPPPRFGCWMSRRHRRELKLPRSRRAIKNTRKRRQKIRDLRHRQSRALPPSLRAAADSHSSLQGPQVTFPGRYANQISTCGALGQNAGIVKPVCHSGLSPSDLHAPDAHVSYFREVVFSEACVAGTDMGERFASDASATPSGAADGVPMSFYSDDIFGCNSWQLAEREMEPLHTTYATPHEDASMLPRPLSSLPPFQPSVVPAANATLLMPIPVQPHTEDASMVPYLTPTLQPHMPPPPHEGVGNPTQGFERSVSGRVIQDYTQPCPSTSRSCEHIQDIPVSKTGKRIVAMDCEMVGCLEVNTPRVQVTDSTSSADKLRSTLNKVEMKPGARRRKRKRNPLMREISVAGRCSIVDYHGRQLYDEYIKPNQQIVNLRTRWSGIKWTDLESAVPFDDAQAEILQLVDGCVVVGHALENDTRSLNIYLPPEQIRDTSYYLPLRRMAKLNCSHPPSLKKLAKALLGLEIQKGSHSSLVDARVSMKLYKLVERKWERVKDIQNGGV